MQSSGEDRHRETLRDSQIPLKMLLKESPLLPGYQVIKLEGDAVFRWRARFSNWVSIKLEDYDHPDFTKNQVELTKKLHSCWEWKEIIEDNAEQLKGFTQIKDIIYQKEPYLRIARTDHPEDNIGIHRDTHYGATENEWVVWVPLTDSISGGELRILPCSHREPEEAYPWTQSNDPAVEKGSEKHWLGFRYAPKKMSKEVEDSCVRVPCFFGEAILFNCACVHGQIVNKAPWTRFSVDIRIADKNSDIQRNRGLHGDIYVEL